MHAPLGTLVIAMRTPRWLLRRQPSWEGMTAHRTGTLAIAKPISTSNTAAQGAARHYM